MKYRKSNIKGCNRMKRLLHLMMGDHSHVSIQLYDKCCKALKDYLNQCAQFHEKEQLLDKSCNDWDHLKRERDTFANEITRRDCCRQGPFDKKKGQRS